MQDPDGITLGYLGEALEKRMPHYSDFSLWQTDEANAHGNLQIYEVGRTGAGNGIGSIGYTDMGIFIE